MEPIKVQTLSEAARKIFESSVPPETGKITSESSLSTQYPEIILQATKNGNRDYNSFQQYDKQFVTGSGLQVMRWDNNSHIFQKLNLVVATWIVAEGRSDHLAKLSDKQRENTTINGSQQRGRISAANALFTWSSSEAYVREKRRQLNEKKARSTKTDCYNAKIVPKSTPAEENADISVDAKPAEDAVSQAKGLQTIKTPQELLQKLPKKPTESMMAKLNRIIEIESNRFVHLRIAEIKEHHNEEMSKQISDRKRRDHEDYLHRIKLKEEEYDRRIQSAGAPKQGFFGTLFGIQNKDVEDRGEKLEKTEKNDKKRFLFLPVRKEKDKEGTSEIRSGSEIDNYDAMQTMTGKMVEGVLEVKSEIESTPNPNSDGTDSKIDLDDKVAGLEAVTKNDNIGPGIAKRDMFAQIEGLNRSNSPSTPISQTFSSGILTPKKKDSPMKTESPKMKETPYSNVADIAADILEPTKQNVSESLQRSNRNHIPLVSQLTNKKDDALDDFGEFSSFEPVATSSSKKSHKFIPLQEKTLIDLDDSNTNDTDLLLI